jgi:glycosyltransferase involved in cell wall biosynthesis
MTSRDLCIVLPTYNRVDLLLECLGHLERQTAPGFEIIVIDDGSTDDTGLRIEAYRQQSPLRLRYLRQENSGPARARNQAVSMTQADLCLFLGDDILVAENFVQTHLSFHRDHPEPRHAALGLTVWSETRQTVTPFMRWLDEGFQFDYRKLLAGATPDWRHFYTSNLSVKTELLRRHPFDERFKRAMLEDCELAWRLTQAEDMRIAFLPAAVAEHVHPTDYRQACNRAFEIGRHIALFPRALPPPASGLRGLLRAVFGREGWPLWSLTALTGFVSRFWCPNPLLPRVMAYRMEAGSRHPL